MEALRRYVVILGYGYCIAFDTRNDAVYLCGRESGDTEWPYHFLGSDLADRDEYKIRKVVLDQPCLNTNRYEVHGEDYAKLDEIILLLQPWDGLQHLPDDKSLWIRVLEREKTVKNDQAWGDLVCQNRFLGWLEKIRAIHSDGGVDPIVKVAQFGYALQDNVSHVSPVLEIKACISVL